MPKDETLVVIARRTRRTTVQALCILQYVEVMVARVIPVAIAMLFVGRARRSRLG